MTTAPTKPHEPHPLDALTGGAFSAATSGDRAARIREWLATQPSPEQMQEVFKELSARDKGAAKPLREKLDELKRAKAQESVAAEWAAKAQALLAAGRLNIADALAWQRDAAKAGAPLSREPLSALKVQLADRVKVVEDLQNQAMVQREAAVLLAQRIEVLSTKSWRDAHAAAETLRTDVQHWQAQAGALVADTNWPSVDAKFPPQLDASRAQLLVVWDAFSAAVAQAAAAADDATAPLPPVPMWAAELRAARGVAAPELAPAPGTAGPARAGKPKMEPAEREALRAKATQAVREVLARVEKEVAEGHGKASAGAAAALRNALKEHGRHLDSATEATAHAALAAAGELEGWQRWRADQLREELVAKAEALIERPRPQVTKKPASAKAAEAPAPAAAQEALPLEGEGAALMPAPPAEGDAQAVVTAERDEDVAEAVAPVAAPVPAAVEAASPEARAPRSRLGGRKMQETLRQLREQWKAIDQGGAPNHALWKRFDEACNEAHKVVEVWLEKVKAEAAEHRAQRLALIEEVKAWTQRNHERTVPHEWKGFARAVHQFADRWRDAGHLSEKAFAELQPLWKEAIHTAALPLETAQKESIARRQAMIEEAVVLGAAPVLRIDAVKALQHRWQAEAQTVPLDRKFEQKLWDAFRKPIDEAFNRKTADREKAAAQLSDRDRVVLDAAKALETANASGDAQAIRAAMAALEAALKGQAQAAAAVQAATTAENESKQAVAQSDQAQAAHETAAPDAAEAVSGVIEAAAETQGQAPEAASAPVPARPAPKPVVAMRGDDRPGMKKAEPAQAGRGGKFGDRRDGPRGPGRPGDNKFEPRRDERAPREGSRFGDPGDRGGRFGDRAYEDRGPRLGDAAFRAQRDALEHAQMALKKLAAQAHGEALTQLLTAWEQRSAEQIPSQQELGRAVPSAVRSSWTQAVNATPQGDASEALLRLEMAAEVPTPAEHLDARRALQLKLLTRRNDPTPAQTWGQDAARVLATAFDAGNARRLQNVLKALLRR